MLHSVLTSLSTFNKSLSSLGKAITTVTKLYFWEFVELILFGASIVLHDSLPAIQPPDNLASSPQLQTVVEAMLYSLKVGESAISGVESSGEGRPQVVTPWQTDTNPRNLSSLDNDFHLAPATSSSDVVRLRRVPSAAQLRRNASDTLRRALEQSKLNFNNPPFEGDCTRPLTAQFLVPSTLKRRVPEPISRVRWNDFYSCPEKMVGIRPIADKSIEAKRKGFYKHLAAVYPFRPTPKTSVTSKPASVHQKTTRRR